MDNSETDLFLIGKTGHGKSTTGNTILGREAFAVSDGAESETNEVSYGFSKRKNRVMKVVNTPGLSETRFSKGEAAKKLVRDMAKGVAQSPQGFHAMLIVLKYGNRFTEEELHTIDSLKTLFGQTFVKDFCILIFTHGDNFGAQQSRKRRPITFEDWCQQQDGPLGSLLNECEFRAVLFDNMNVEMAEEQLQKLLLCVDGLKSKGKRYTNDLFEKVSKDREMLIVKENAQIIREEVQSKIDILVDSLDGFKECIELDDTTKQKMRELNNDAMALRDEIVSRDKGTGVLKVLSGVVANIMQNVETHAGLMRAYFETKQKEESMKQMEQEYEKKLKQEEIERKKREQELIETQKKHEEEVKQSKRDREEMMRELEKTQKMAAEARENEKRAQEKRDTELAAMQKNMADMKEENRKEKIRNEDNLREIKIKHLTERAQLVQAQAQRAPVGLLRAAAAERNRGGFFKKFFSCCSGSTPGSHHCGAHHNGTG